MTTTTTPTPERAAWEERGITDPAVMLRLTQVELTIDVFDAYLDASVDSITEMYRLKNARVTPELANAYRMEAPVSVEEMVVLNNANVSPKLLKALLAQFPGFLDRRRAGPEEGRHRQGMLTLLTKKLGVTDPDVMTKLAKAFTASDLSEFIALGATLDDVWVDGETVRPDKFFLLLRRAGHPDLHEFFKDRRPFGYDESPAKLQKLIGFALEARALGLGAELVSRWYPYNIDVTTAARFHDVGFDYEHYALMEDLGGKIGRTDYVHMAEVAYEYPGMLILLVSRRGNGSVERDMVDSTLIDHFREDFEGTAKAVRNVISRGPAVRSFQQGQELYRGMTGYDAAVWQSSILGEVFGDLEYSSDRGHRPGKDYAPTFSYWELFGAERLKVRNPPDADLIRRQVASGIRSGVNSRDYFRLVKLGVPKREMASVVRQAEAMALSGITREMVGLPELEEDEGFTQATTRPEFDWDDDTNIEEGT